MKSLVLSVTLLATPLALAGPDGGAPPPVDAGTADAGVPFVLGGDAQKGAAKYKTLCLSCHGPKGRGDGTAAKAARLDPKPTNFTDPKNAERLTAEWVYLMIRDGGPTHGKSPLMVSWGGTLSDQDVRNLAAWILTFKAAPKPKTP